VEGVGGTMRRRGVIGPWISVGGCGGTPKLGLGVGDRKVELEGADTTEVKEALVEVVAMGLQEEVIMTRSRERRNCSGQHEDGRVTGIQTLQKLMFSCILGWVYIL
jgi:hypothetical protein